MKKCTNKNCKNPWKDKTQFYKNKNNKDGLHNWCKDCEKEYKKLNREKISARSKEYLSKNKEHKKNRDKIYNQSPPGKFNSYKNNAKKRNINFNLIFSEFILFWQKPCQYCGSEIETIGLDRIDNNIGYELNNVCSCCEKCNLAKRTMNVEEWNNYINKLILFQLKQKLVNKQEILNELKELLDGETK